MAQAAELPGVGIQGARGAPAHVGIHAHRRDAADAHERVHADCRPAMGEPGAERLLEAHLREAGLLREPGLRQLLEPDLRLAAEGAQLRVGVDGGGM